MIGYPMDNYANIRLVNIVDITSSVLNRPPLKELRALRKRVKEQRKQLRDLNKAYAALQWRIQLDLKGIR